MLLINGRLKVRITRCCLIFFQTGLSSHTQSFNMSSWSSFQSNNFHPIKKLFWWEFQWIPSRVLHAYIGKWQSVLSVCMLLSSFKEKKNELTIAWWRIRLWDIHMRADSYPDKFVCPWIITSKYYLRNTPSKYCQEALIDFFSVMSTEWQEEVQ